MMFKFQTLYIETISAGMVKETGMLKIPQQYNGTDKKINVQEGRRNKSAKEKLTTFDKAKLLKHQAVPRKVAPDCPEKGYLFLTRSLDKLLYYQSYIWLIIVVYTWKN